VYSEYVLSTSLRLEAIDACQTRRNVEMQGLVPFGTNCITMQTADIFTSGRKIALFWHFTQH
jgi:hypothetical protein